MNYANHYAARVAMTSPPVRPPPMAQMPDMTDDEAIKSEQGYYGPPLQSNRIDLDNPPQEDQAAAFRMRAGKVEYGKTFIDRIEDNGVAVLINPDGSKMDMPAQPGWKEGMYIDPPKPQRKRPVP